MKRMRYFGFYNVWKKSLVPAKENPIDAFFTFNIGNRIEKVPIYGFKFEDYINHGENDNSSWLKFKGFSEHKGKCIKEDGSPAIENIDY